MKPLFELLMPGERLVAFVGGGGKTTLARTLARQLAGRGRKVIMTATTDTPAPPRNLLLLDSAMRVPPYSQLTLARDVNPDTGLLTGVDPGDVPGLMERFRADVTLVEAGEASGRSLCVPGAPGGEVPAGADLVVAVVGLDALHRSADEETVAGLAEFTRITGTRPGEIIGSQAIEALAAHPDGLFRGCPERARQVVFHNKADVHAPSGQLFGSALLGWFVHLA